MITHVGFLLLDKPAFQTNSIPVLPSDRINHSVQLLSFISKEHIETVVLYRIIFLLNVLLFVSRSNGSCEQ
jgi:hypothetical protein